MVNLAVVDIFDFQFSIGIAECIPVAVRIKSDSKNTDGKFYLDEPMTGEFGCLVTLVFHSAHWLNLLIVFWFQISSSEICFPRNIIKRQRRRIYNHELYCVL